MLNDHAKYCDTARREIRNPKFEAQKLETIAKPKIPITEMMEGGLSCKRLPQKTSPWDVRACPT
jgi:hypothetical protein